MRLMWQTRHRRVVILTGDDATSDDDEIGAVVDNTGGDFQPAAPPFGFGQPDEDDDE
jgi:hypothetical protein